MNMPRKSTRPLLIIVWLIFSAVVPIRAGDPTNQVRSATQAAREDASQRRAKLPIAKGTLKEVDLLRHQFKVATEDGVRTFTYTARTYMFRDKDKITADKLKVGDIIALRFETDKDGNTTVIRMKTYSAPPASDAAVPNPPASTNQHILDDSLAR
jgi:Cu/Ag efflux protein CusF